MIPKLLKITAVGLLLTLAACTESGTQSNDPLEPPRRVTQLTVQEREALQAFNQFGWKLFRAVYDDAEANDNIFISPLSVAYALGMAVNGARGETRDSLLAALEFNGLTLDEVNAAYNELYRILAAADKSVKFTLANSFWSDAGIGIVPEYRERLEEFFDADGRDIEFQDAATPGTINKWVSDRTGGKITDIVPTPIPEDWIAMILNAIYFKGNWSYPFDTRKTSAKPFTLADGTVIDVPMMTRTMYDDVRDFRDRLRNRPIGVFESSVARGFSLPYGKAGFKMTVVLPPEGSTLAQTVGEINIAAISAWGDSPGLSYSSIWLPKFRFKWNDSLRPMLEQIGFGVMFDPGRADFRDMFSEQNAWVGEVIHSSYVQVDEKGTEAAAATVVGFPTSAPPDFLCNQPFLFVIQESTSKAILFIGKIGEPVWEN